MSGKSQRDNDLNRMRVSFSPVWVRWIGVIAPSQSWAAIQGSGLQLGCAFGGCRFICIQQGVWEREGEGRILPRRWWWARPRSLEAMHIPSDAYPLSIIQSWLQLISKKAGKCSWNNEPKKYSEPHSPTYQWFHPNVICLLFPCLTSSMLMVIICINSLQM